MEKITINCITYPEDTITFGQADKFREMVVIFCYDGKEGDIHISNVEALAIINHLKEQFGL